jgi:hypothetical protein
VFHRHIGETSAEEGGEELVELLRVPPLALALGDEDAPNARVAGPRNAEPG